MSITRRLFLRHTAAVGATIAVGPAAAIDAAQAAPTPDERIAAAIQEVKAAFREKWSNAPLRIVDHDHGGHGMLMVVSHVANDKLGCTRHERFRNGVETVEREGF